ncbi:MAG: DNA gyrase inhibitor YacG [Deltaproteobacteria bacterium]|nr:MAG: DNA gyrase inhibitor YacG [Deltaproteobacteria bacterium]
MKVRCPRCNRVVEWEGNEWRPFCSERCKLIDLGAWVSEEYRISGERVSYGDDISQSEEDGE